MRVLISGGGIAGLTLAYWLHEYGISSLVIERAPHIRHDGYGLDFYGTGYDVAERMGILEQLKEQQMRFEDISYVDTHGSTIAHVNRALMEKIMRQRYMALMHWTLEEVLYEAIANTVEIRYSTTLTSIQSSAEQVSVTFSDGTTEHFDLLLGADGVHSRVRRLVFGEDALFQHQLGYAFASYQLPDRYGVGHAWKNYIEPKRWVSAYCTNKEGEIATLLLYKTADTAYAPPEQRLSRLQKAFQNTGWITQGLLEDAPDPHAIFYDTMTQIQMPHWSLGRVALVGDACGCPTSLSGQGASIAMGGAYMLAQALHTMPDYTSAFRYYEQQVRPHVEKRQKNAQSIARTFVPETSFALTMQRFLFKLLLREAWSNLLRQQFGADSFLPPLMA